MLFRSIFMMSMVGALLRGRKKKHMPFQINHNNTLGWLRTNKLIQAKIPFQTHVEQILQNNNQKLYENIRKIEYRVENQLQSLRTKSGRDSTWELMFILAVAWAAIASCITLCLCVQIILNAKNKKNK